MREIPEFTSNEDFISLIWLMKFYDRVKNKKNGEESITKEFHFDSKKMEILMSVIDFKGDLKQMRSCLGWLRSKNSNISKKRIILTDEVIQKLEDPFEQIFQKQTPKIYRSIKQMQNRTLN